MIQKIRFIFAEELVEAVGWTIFHSLWQGAVVALALILTLHLLRKHSARVKYLVAYLSLVVFVIWTSSVFIASYNYAREKNEAKASFMANPDLITKIISEEINKSGEPAVETKEVYLWWIKFRALLQRNFPVVFTLWLCGMIIFLMRMAGSMLYIYRLRTRLIIPLDESWQEKITEFANKIGLTRKVEVLSSRMAKTPMTVGSLKPIILFPVKLLTGLNQAEIEAILAHELAHILRHDYLLNFIQSIIEILFFYHPGIWLISKIIRDEREHSCDELALEITNDRLSYTKALAATTEVFNGPTPRFSLAFGTRGSSLLQRVQKIKNHTTMKKNVTEGFIAATLVFVSLLLLSFTFDSSNLKKTEVFEDETNRTERKIAAILPIPQPENKTVSKRTKAHRDSVNRKLVYIAHDLDNVSDEMDQLIEIACSQNDEEFSRMVLLSLEEAMAAVNMDSIMVHVDSVMSNIDFEAAMIDAQKLQDDMRMELESIDIHEEALAEAMHAIQEIEIDTTLIFKIEKDVRVAIEDVDVAAIVEQAMETARVALESIDFEAISADALEQTRHALEEIELDHESIRNDIEKAKRSIEDQLREMEGKMDELEAD